MTLSEIAFEEGKKEGRKEVTEWIKEMGAEEDFTDFEHYQRTSVLFDKEAWQAQLKKWGID